MNDLSITMKLTPEIAGELSKSSGLLAFVREAYPAIEDSDIANLAATQRKDCLAVVAKIKELKTGFVAPARQIIAQAEALFDGPMENAKAAADHCGTLLLDWDAKEKARVAAERRAQEESERKIRAEAEAKAAAIRAKAEQEAREAARKAQEAAAAVAKAQSEGNAKAAAKAAAEAAKAASEAEAKAEADRIKAAQVEAEAAARIAAAPVVEAEKVAGFSSRKNWKARHKSGYAEQDVLIAIGRAIFGLPADAPVMREELLAFVAVDIQQAHKAAKTYESKMNIPGLEAFNAAVATSR